MIENQNEFEENGREQANEPTPTAAPEAPAEMPVKDQTPAAQAPTVADAQPVTPPEAQAPAEQPSTEDGAPDTPSHTQASPVPTAEQPPVKEGAPEAPAGKAQAPAENAAETVGAIHESPAADKPAPADAPAETGKKGKKKKKEKKPKKQKRLRKKHPILRVFGAFLRFTLTLLLGMAIAYGSLVGVVYYAFSGLTIDTLQRFGIAKGADAILTQNGEIDLTSTSILELLADLNTVRADLSNHTLGSLIARYGLELPEGAMSKLPTDLFDVPLDQFASGNVGGVIAEKLKFGYILSMLPSGMVSEQLKSVLADRPLALLTTGEYGALFSGIKLGYLLGVSFDENGNVQHADAAHPTLQETMATIDLGTLLTAVSKNGDILGVLASDIGDSELRPVLTGVINGALVDKMCEGLLIGDVILPDAETGRYRIDLNVLTSGLFIGDVLGYKFVNDTWYTAYTDNEDDTDDTVAPKMNAKIAAISVADVIGGRVVLEESFADVYFGDLQSGYVRGDAITEEEPESGETVVVGYQWLKDGAPVGKMQQQLANIAANDLIGGKLDINKTLGTLFVGDLQGYRRVEVTDPESGEVIDHKWMKTEGDTEVEVNAMLSAVADISISALLNGELDIVATLGDLKFGQVQGYILGEDGLWYREVQGEEGTTLEYVGAMQNSLASIPLADVLNGEFSLTEAFADLYFGDLQSGYVRGDAITEEDPESGETVVVGYKWLKDGAPVGKMQQELANIALPDLLNGQLDVAEALGDLSVGDLQSYERVELTDPDTGEVIGHKWMKTEGDTKVEVSPVMSAIADISVADMLNGKLDIATALGDLKLGDVQGYTLGEDGHWYQEVTGEQGTTLEKVSNVQNSIASVPLSDVMNGKFSLTESFDGLYLGDLQSGYVRGDAITEEDPESGESVVVGYEWTKDGAPVSLMQKELANVALTDLLNGEMDLGEILGDLRLGDVQGYTLATDGLWYREVQGEEGTTLEYVGAVQNSIANVPLSDVMNGEFSLTDATEGLLMGEAMGYVRGDVITPADPTDPTSTDKYAFTKKDNTEVTGTMLELANLPLVDVLNGNVDFEDTIRGMTLAEVLNFTQKDDGWYDGEEKVTGVLAALADKKINEINSETLDTVALGEILGYTFDEESNTWYDGSAPAVGAMGKLAGLKLGDLSSDDTVMSKLRELTLADAMGYTYDEENGIWLDQNNNELTGVLKVLATKPLNELNSTTIDAILLGDALGYTYDEANGVWLNKNGEKVTGALAVLAGKRIDEINSQTLDAIKIGEVLGYTFDTEENAWYNGTEPATGVMATLASLTLGDLSNDTTVSDKLRELTLAEAMGYTYDEANGVWLDQSSNKLTGVLGVLAGKPLNEINSAAIDAILLGDALGYNYDKTNGVWLNKNGEKVTGALAVLAGKRIDEINSQTLDAIKIGEVLGYTFDAEENVWYNGTEPATGIMATLSSLGLGDLSDNGKVTEKLRELTLADAMGYTYDEANGVWLDQNENVLTGMMAQMAGLTVGELENSSLVAEKLSNVELFEVLGYKKVGSSWQNSQGQPVSGVIAYLLETPVGQMEGKINEMPLGYAFGFVYDDVAGKWYTNATDKTEPTGITASLVNIHLGNARAELEDMKLGNLLGYELKDNGDGTFAWQDKNGPVSGLGLVLVDLPLIELGNEDKIASAMQKATLGTALGFKKVKLDGDTEERWYKTTLDQSGNAVVDKNSPVTGLMGALADKKIGVLESEIETITIGTMLDFTEVDGTWYDKNGQKVTGALAVLAGSDLESLSDNIQNMTVADMWPEREGILSAIDGSTKISELDKAVENCTVGALIDAGVINVKPTQAAFFDIKISGWRDLNAVGFINALLGLVG